LKLFVFYRTIKIGSYFPFATFDFTSLEMHENTYSTLKFDNWNDYKDFVDDLSENWVFRGQSNTQWELENAIERTDFIHLYRGIEIDFLAEFQRGARNYLNKDETPEYLIEWLALMQHHGAPTRLLDFSRSPFIGAYFAFEELVNADNSNVAVWAINVQALKEHALRELKKTYSSELEESNNIIDEKLFKKIFFDNNCSLIFPVEPFRMNRRYSLQQSTFVSTGNSHDPFMKQLYFLKNSINQAVIKIELPGRLQKQVLRNLQRMNLNRASLFPDLDGYALSLKLRYNSVKTPEELENEKKEKLESDQFSFYP
jgi:hypothetical protein